jgi:DHA2 family multidrug resistance protein
MFAMLMANMFLLPLFMQELLGFTATQSGLALMPRVLVMMVATPLVGRIYNLVSPRLIIGLGVLFFSWGAWKMSHLTLASGSNDVVAAIAIQGIGFACLFVPLTTVALSNVPRHRIADATGLNSLLRQVGGAIGLAIFATLLARGTNQARVALVSNVTAGDPLVVQRLGMLTRALAQRGVAPTQAPMAAIAALDGQVQAQASTIAFDKIFLLAGVLFLLVIPLLWFLRTNPDRPAQVHVE